MHRRGIAPAIAALFVALAVAAVASAVKLNYPNFSNVRGLKLNGDAAKVGSILRLTDGNDDAGTVHTKRKVVDPRKSFKTQFRIRMHDGSPVPGDGMAFVIHREGKGAIGDLGGGLGYGGFAPSIAIEFDIYDNGGEPEPASNHVGLMLNGNPGDHVESGDPGYPLATSTTFAWIKYAARSKRFKLWVNDEARKPSRPLISRRQNLKQLLGGKSRAGFAAATGASTIVADVERWKLGQR